MTRRPSLRLALLLIAATVSALAPAVVPELGQAVRRDRKDVKTEVVRGLAVPDGKYPFVAAIGLVNDTGGLKRQFCGGSLIAPSYVLTAAHCVAGAKPESIAVVVGQSAFDTGQGETRTLTAIMIHPGFNRRTLGKDVAVLQLSAPILSIAPAARVGASDASFEVSGTPLTVVGWGDTVRYSLHRNKNRYPERLQEGTVTVVGTAHCSKQWRQVGFKKQFSSSIHLCTSARRFGAGDSGSPLFSLVGGAYVQVSLVSGGFVGTKRKISDFGPRLSEPSIAAFITTSVGG